MKKYLLKMLLGVVMAAFAGAHHATAQSKAFQWVNGGGGQGLSFGSEDDEICGLMSADGKGHIYAFTAINKYQVRVDTFVRSNTYNSYSDLLLSSWSCDGKLRWARPMGDLYFDMPYGIASDGNGNVYICGTGGGSGSNTFRINDTLVSAGVAKNTFFIAKYDSTGRMRWLRFPGMNNAYTQNRVWKLSMDASGKLVVFAQMINCPSNQFEGFPVAAGSFRNLYRFRMDTASGNVTDLIRIQGISGTGNNGSFFASTIETDPAGNSYMMLDLIQGDTITVNGITATTDAYRQEYMIASFDNTGNARWAHKVAYELPTGTGIFHPQLIIKPILYDNGNLYIAGGMFKSYTYNSTLLNNPNQDTNQYCGMLMNLNPVNGSLSWYKTIRTAPGSFFGNGLILLDMAKTANNEIAMTGDAAGIVMLNTSDTLKPVPGTAASTGLAVPAILYDINTQQMNGGSLAATDATTSRCIAADNNGNVFVGGGFYNGRMYTTTGSSLSFNGGPYDFFIARYGNVNGCTNCTTAMPQLTSFLKSGNSVTVKGTSTPADSLLWLWGDGTRTRNTAANAAVSHTYASGQTYNICLRAYNTCGYRDTCLSTALSVSVLPAGRGISVYPNPANEHILLVCSEAGTLHYTLYDISGRLVLQGRADTARNSVDISQLRDGLYLLRCALPNGEQAVTKVTISR